MLRIYSRKIQRLDGTKSHKAESQKKCTTTLSEKQSGKFLENLKMKIENGTGAETPTGNGAP
jgi:hypothetical protein